MQPETGCFEKLAEREGFEPSVEYYPYNRLAGGCLQPLGHLSASIYCSVSLAEGEGFEPPRACARRISSPLPYQLGLALRRKNYSPCPKRILAEYTKFNRPLSNKREPHL
jgi:hypothetical protein